MSSINVNNLQEIKQVIPGDFFVVQIPGATAILDYKNLVIDLPNVTFSSAVTTVSANSTSITSLSTQLLALSSLVVNGALSGVGVSSINGHTGTVVLVPVDINLGNVNNTSDLNKPVSTIQGAINLALSGAINTDISNIQALSAQFASLSGISGVASVNTRTGAVVLTKADVSLSNVDNTSDANKPVSTAQAAADSAATAAAQTTSNQRSSNLADVANVTTARSNLGLGSAATQSSAAFDAAGAASAVSASSLQKASNLSDVSNAATSRSNLGLGTAAIANKVAAGSPGVLDATDATTTNSRAPNGSAGGDLSGTYPNPTLATSGVAAATYGSATQVPQIAFDAKGRATSASNVTIAALPVGGSKYARLAKNSTTNYDVGWLSAGWFNVQDYGATGNGITNDTTAINAAMSAMHAAGKGTVYFPDGRYLISSAITFPSAAAGTFAIKGNGAYSSTIIQSGSNADGIYVDMSGGSDKQYNWIEICDLGFQISGVTCGRAICVDYRAIFQNSIGIGPSVHDIFITLGTGSGWTNGVHILYGWFSRVYNIYGWGNPSSYDAGSGAGSGAFVNLYAATNSQVHGIMANYFYRGVALSARGTDFYQGILLTDIHCVQCPVSISITAEPSTNCGAISIVGCQLDNGNIGGQSLACALSVSNVSEVYVDGVHSINNAVVVKPIDIHNCTGSGFLLSHSQLYTAFTSTTAINLEHVTNGVITGSTFAGFTTDVTLSPLTSGVKISDCINIDPTKSTDTTITAINLGTTNSIYTGAKAMVYRTSNQTFTNGVEDRFTPQAAKYNTGGIWSAGDPTKLTIPSGASFVRVSCGMRWTGNTTGYRTVKIKTNTGAIYAASDFTTGQSGDTVIIMPPVSTAGLLYFVCDLTQGSGGNLDLRGVDGSYFALEVIE